VNDQSIMQVMERHLSCWGTCLARRQKSWRLQSGSNQSVLESTFIAVDLGAHSDIVIPSVRGSIVIIVVLVFRGNRNRSMEQVMVHREIRYLSKERRRQSRIKASRIVKWESLP
jgi:hypothetical protein